MNKGVAGLRWGERDGRLKGQTAELCPWDRVFEP